MAFLIALCGGIIMNKTKRMLKNAAISVGIGAVPAFVVLWLCNLFMKVNELTLIARITHYVSADECVIISVHLSIFNQIFLLL